MATSAKKSAPPTASVKTIAAVNTPAKKTASIQTVKTSAAKKSTAKPATAKPATVKKVTAPEMHLKASTAPKRPLTTEQRNHYVAVAAFYIAERRGFTLGRPQDDWIAAEAEIDRLIASGHFSF